MKEGRKEEGGERRGQRKGWDGGMSLNLIHSFLQISEQSPRNLKIKFCG